jgi:hypothetical protein
MFKFSNGGGCWPSRSGDGELVQAALMCRATALCRQAPAQEAQMGDQNSREAEERRQTAEASAEVVLAKHPCVVAGSVDPKPDEVIAPAPRPAGGEARPLKT